MKIQSTLTNISESVWSAKNAQEAKEIIISYLETTNVKDKQKMIYDVVQLKNLTKVQFYFANSLLKYEGLGLNKKTSE